MKKISSLAFYAMVTPIITLGSGALLAQANTGQEEDSSQHEQDAAKYPPSPAAQTTQSSRQADATDGNAAAMPNSTMGRAHMPSRGYMTTVPANGIQVSDLIGAEVSTSGDEEVGPVDDLIINSDGQVMGIVVGVGGFLGIGEKIVAIGWDDVTKTGQGDDLILRIDVSRDDLRTAPEYKAAE